MGEEGQSVWAIHPSISVRLESRIHPQQFRGWWIRRRTVVERYLRSMSSQPRLLLTSLIDYDTIRLGASSSILFIYVLVLLVESINEQFKFWTTVVAVVSNKSKFWPRWESSSYFSSGTSFSGGSQIKFCAKINSLNIVGFIAKVDTALPSCKSEWVGGNIVRNGVEYGSKGIGKLKQLILEI